MLIKYIRDGLERIGVIVATGPDKVGWSVCNHKDRFDKRLGKVIASGRANKGSNAPYPTREVCSFQYDKESDDFFLTFRPLDEILHDEIGIMKERAARYYNGTPRLENVSDVEFEVVVSGNLELQDAEV